MKTSHTPKNFDPKEYEIIGYIDNNPPTPPFISINISETLKKEIFDNYYIERENWRKNCEGYFGNSWGEKIHSCSHCGHSNHTRYIAVVKHLPTNEIVPFGHICADRIGFSNKAEFRLAFLKDKASKDKVKNEKLSLKLTFLSEHVGLEEKLNTKHHIIENIKSSLNLYGKLSEKQIELVDKIINQIAESEAKKLVEENLPRIECIEGRVEISGEILGLKTVETDFGNTLKCVVRDDRGFKVYGSVPHAYDENDYTIHFKKGDKIKFVATVTKSNDDLYFGFFKRPKIKA